MPSQKTPESWEKELRQKAKEHVLKHGLVSATATPTITWQMGFFESVEWLIPLIRDLRKKDKEANDAKHRNAGCPCGQCANERLTIAFNKT